MGHRGIILTTANILRIAGLAAVRVAAVLVSGLPKAGLLPEDPKLMGRITATTRQP